MRYRCDGSISSSISASLQDRVQQQFWWKAWRILTLNIKTREAYKQEDQKHKLQAGCWSKPHSFEEFLKSKTHHLMRIWGKNGKAWRQDLWGMMKLLSVSEDWTLSERWIRTARSETFVHTKTWDRGLQEPFGSCISNWRGRMSTFSVSGYVLPGMRSFSKAWY